MNGARLDVERESVHTQASSYGDMYSTDRPMDEKGWKDERQAWDIFKMNSAETRFQESHSMMKCFQQVLLIIAYLCSFVFVFGASLVSYSSFLFMTSNIKVYSNSPIQRGGTFNGSRRMVVMVNFADRFCQNKNITRLPYENLSEPGPRWMWVTYFAVCLPQLFTIIKCFKKILLRKRTKPTPFLFIISFIAETLHTLAIGILVFGVLPNLDTVSCCMIAPTICLIPAILQPLSRSTKTQYYLPKLLMDLVALVGQISALVYWVAGPYRSDHWKMTLALGFISFVWWDNYIDRSVRIPFLTKLAKYKESMRRNRAAIHLFLSLWNVLLLFAIMIMFSTNYYGLKELFDTDVFSYDSALYPTRIRTTTPSITTTTPMNATTAASSTTKFTTISSLTPLIPSSTTAILPSPAALVASNMTDHLLLKGGKHMERYMDFVVALTLHVFSSLLLYYVSTFACKTVLQKFSFAFPLLVSGPVLVYVMMFLTELRIANPCFLASVIPSRLYWNLEEYHAENYAMILLQKPHKTLVKAAGQPDNLGMLMNYTGYLWIWWMLSVCWITLHVWYPSGERLEQTSKLFTLPMYCPVFTSISMLLSRTRETPDVEAKNRLNMQDSMDLGSTSSSGSDQQAQASNVIPRIYFCATMWHENLTEITQLMKSICRMDIDQNSRRMRKNYMKVVDADYYEFEVNIFFDDSMTTTTVNLPSPSAGVRDASFPLNDSALPLGPPLPPPNASSLNDPNMITLSPAPSQRTQDGSSKVSGEKMIKTTVVRANQFVILFIRALKDAADSTYDSSIVLSQPTKTLSPYGGRMVWKLPGRNKIVVHLKNKKMIRAKKRWSQVMYMYYLLGFRHNKRIARCGDKALAQEVADNTFVLALDGDVDFQPISVIRLVDLMKKNSQVASACGRIHPAGSGPLVWYQKFEYALGHWLQKAAEHMIGCVLCSPGCFSLFRGSALMADNVARAYTKMAEEPWQMVQYDQGEDRWLCTLILQQGYRIEYSAASDAVTYSPEGFDEFFNQRRRWIPSTMANILDLLRTYRKTVALNETITFSYIIYQAMMFVSTLIGPAVIILLLVGSISATFYLSLWGSIAVNTIPVIIFIIMCFKTSTKHQLLYAKIMAALYAIAMLSFIIRAMLQIHEEGIESPAAIFIILLVSVIFAASLLHPEEFKNVIYGLLYLLVVPTMYLILIIYSLCNLNIVSWGTREIAKVQLEKSQGVKKVWIRTIWDDMKKLKVYIPCMSLEENTPNRRKSFLSLRRLGSKKSPNTLAVPQANNDPNQISTANSSNQELGGTSNLGNSSNKQGTAVIPTITIEKASIKEEPIKEIKPSDANWWNSTWTEDPDLPPGPISSLSGDEIRFWEELIEKYLKPIELTEEKKKEIAEGLRQLRNRASFGFLLANLIFIIIVLMLQMNKDNLNIKWYITGTKKFLKLEPLSLALMAFFIIILGIQFIAMLFHRWNTLLHILASTELFCFKKNDKEIPMEIHSPEALKKYKAPRFPFMKNNANDSGVRSNNKLPIPGSKSFAAPNDDDVTITTAKRKGGKGNRHVDKCTLETPANRPGGIQLATRAVPNNPLSLNDDTLHTSNRLTTSTPQNARRYSMVQKTDPRQRSDGTGVFHDEDAIYSDIDEGDAGHASNKTTHKVKSDTKPNLLKGVLKSTGPQVTDYNKRADRDQYLDDSIQIPVRDVGLNPPSHSREMGLSYKDGEKAESANVDENLRGSNTKRASQGSLDSKESVGDYDDDYDKDRVGTSKDWRMA